MEQFERNKGMIAPNTVLSNRYLVTDLLGQGGMGAVYKASDKKFNNFVAIKETINTNDSQMRNAFLQEATLLNRLRHPALPVVTDFFVLGNNMYLVMQYIPGKSVDALLEERELLGYRGIDAKLAVKWSDRLMDAVEYLHTQEAPIIHRDIKPQNLRLTPEGELVLLDFGLAKGVPIGRSHAARSIPGYTPNYSSPEQIRCTGTDHRSDIYSIGATMYHMLTGEKPVEVLGRLVAQAMKEPDPLQPVLKVNPDIPYMTAQVIEKAMSFQPEDRYPTVVVMRQALRKAELITELADQIPDSNDPIYINGLQDQTGYTGAIPTYEASGQLRHPTATVAVPSRDASKTILYNSQQEPALYAAAAANGASRILNSYRQGQAQSQPLPVNVPMTGIINPGKQQRKKFFSKALPLNPKVWVTIGFVFVAYMAIYSFLGNFSNIPFVILYNRVIGNAEATGGGKATTTAPAVLKNYSSPVEAFRYSVVPKKSRNGSVESYKLLFNAKMNGYVYLFSAAKDGNIQALITNGATVAKDGASNNLEANKDFQYPANKDNWLKFADRSNTASYLVVFTPEKLDAPDFFSFLPGSVMSPPQVDALKTFRKLSDSFVPTQSEGSKSEAIVQIPGDIGAKRPLIFKIDLQLKK